MKIFGTLISGVGYCSEYQAILDRATALGYTLPSIAIQIAQNAFILALKLAGIWTKIDILHVMMNGDASLHLFAQLNWKNPATFQLTETNSPTYSIWGFTGNGSNAVLKTGWIPSVNGVNFTQNDCTIFAAQVESIASTTTLMGGSTSGAVGRILLDTRIVGDQWAYEINQHAAALGTIEDGEGFWQVKRTASNANAIFLNGASIGTGVVASDATSTKEIYYLAENVNGVTTLPTPYTISIGGAGASLTTPESVSFSSAWYTYYQAIMTGAASSLSFPAASSTSYSDYFTPRLSMNSLVRQFEKINTFGTINAGGLSSYECGVCAPNGFIYCAPATSTGILKINTATGATSLIGNFAGSLKYVGGVYDPGTGKIFFIPHSSSVVLWLDTANDSTGTFGSVGAGATKWVGGVLATNGFIYGIPFNDPTVLKIDPVNLTASQFGSTGAGTGKWAGGALASNGKIYCVPFNNTTILVIDPATDTTSAFGSIAGTNKYSGAITAPNGFIYCVSYDATDILKINPSNNTTSQFGSTGAGSAKWGGGALACNGIIYCLPQQAATTILKIDTTNDTVGTFGSLGALKYVGAVLANNGQVWGIPSAVTNGKLCTVLTKLPYTLSDNVCLSRFVNHF